MKHLITMMACVMLLMALLSQFVQNQTLLLQLETGSHAVDIFCKDKNETELRKSLSRVMNCEMGEIGLRKDGNKVVITVPVKSVLATPGFWGITEEENHGQYCWERKMEDG